MRQPKLKQKTLIILLVVLAAASVVGLVSYAQDKNDHSYAPVDIETEGSTYTFLFDRNPIRYSNDPGTIQGKSLDGASDLVLMPGPAAEYIDGCEGEGVRPWFTANTKYGDRQVCYSSTGAYGAKVDIKLAYMYLNIDGQFHHIGIGPPGFDKDGSTYDKDIDLATARTIMESISVDSPQAEP